MFCSNDVAEKVDEMSLESDDDDRVQPVSKFGLLNIEDAGDSDSEPDSDTVSSDTKQTQKKKHIAAAKVEDKILNKGATKKLGNKGKIDAKKSKDDEDIELLAELNAPKGAKSGEKKDRKKKKGGATGDVVDQADVSTQPNALATTEPEIDYRNMTQDEIAKLMEEQYGEDSEEERKKAKAKKKTRKVKDETKQTENGEVKETLGKIIDKPNAQVRKDEENADVEVEITKPTKKQNKKAQQKQTEVFVGIFHVLLVTEYCKIHCTISIVMLYVR